MEKLQVQRLPLIIWSVSRVQTQSVLLRRHAAVVCAGCSLELPFQTCNDFTFWNGSICFSKTTVTTFTLHITVQCLALIVPSQISKHPQYTKKFFMAKKQPITSVIWQNMTWGKTTKRLFCCMFRTNLFRTSKDWIPQHKSNHSLHRERSASQSFAGRCSSSAASDGDQPASSYRTKKEEGPWRYWYAVLFCTLKTCMMLALCTNLQLEYVLIINYTV